MFPREYSTKNSNFKLRHFIGIHKEGHLNHRAHGGVAIFIHETLPYKEIELNTPIQAVAAQISIGKPVTVASIYNSRSHQINESLLTDILKQLPKPVILTGDFNAYHHVWGSPEIDNRGTQVFNFTQNNNLNIINDLKENL